MLNLFLFLLLTISSFAEDSDYYPTEEELDAYSQFADQQEERIDNYQNPSKSPFKDREATPTLLPFTLTTEVMGRTGAFSINLDYSFYNYFAVGVGSLFLFQRKGTKDITTFIMPLYANFYATRSEHRPFLTVGSNLIKINVQDQSDPNPESRRKVTVSGMFPTYGVGYELRLKIGFVFRIALYRTVLFGVKDSPMLGLSFGGSFHINKFKSSEEN